MNLLQTLLREHSKAMCREVVAYVGHNPGRFEELVKLFLKGPYRVSQRAAWPISYCVEANPQLIDPHLKRIVRNLSAGDLSVAVKRNIVRLLQFIPIPKSLQGEVADTCFQFLKDGHETIAVRAFSMSVLFNIAQVETELQRELQIALEDLLPHASVAIRTRARNLLRRLNATPIGRKK